ncbi:MAG TPA: inorganic phosphate transporter [Hyphomicrobiaceae bacterium]|jgi:PiT family inorganic phosphate transporter|nr:inorganic phosphate transporter [Hyphomicrobiaceae bacterium]
MEVLTVALVIALATVLAAEFVNGWTDAPNVIATIVSTGVLAPRLAIAMAVLFNILGAMGGTAVAATVGRGIVDPSAMTLPAITAAMLSIIFWGGLAARLGIPVSKSHALLAGLAGAGLAGGGWTALQWTGWQKVGIGLMCSLVLGFAGAWLIGRAIIVSAGNARPVPARRLFDRLQLLSAAFMAFNHGLNDGQKFMGVFALTMLAGGATDVFDIPLWVMLVCALTMGVGTSFGGWRIIQTVGMKMARITSWQGFAAQTSAAFTIFGASHFGIPLSTTHTITTAIVGSSAAARTYDVRWGVLRRIVLAWCVTFPFCAFIAFAAALVANRVL